MNINNPLWLIFGLILAISCCGLAQSSYQAGILPSVNINHKFKNDWSINYKIESRQQQQSGIFGGEKEVEYRYILTDNSLILARNIGLNARLAGGYLLRIREGQLVHRLIQQYAITQRFTNFRLAHRIVVDQTISDFSDVTLRLRYRLSTEIPLNGQAADTKEFYIKLNNEYLNEFQSGVYDMEVRLVPMLGYAITRQQKLEMGLDYRLSSFLINGPEQRFWLSFNWYIVI